MANFEGKWKLTSTENFDKYMEEVGVGLVTRKMASTASPVQEITVNGDEWQIKTTTTFKTTDVKFKLGQEFAEETADGRKVKTTCTLDGNKLIQSQKGEPKDSVLTREFTGDKMTMTLKAGNVVSTRIYERQK